MIEISNLLKEARLNKGLSLENVSNEIKISPEHLKNIEENNQEELPHRPYVRGFVKTYSDYLKLDTFQILEDFNETVGTTIPTPQQQQIEKDNWKSIPLINRLKFSNTTRIFLLICILALATLAGNQVYKKYAREAITNKSNTTNFEQKLRTPDNNIIPEIKIEKNLSKAPEKNL